ncbi:MAG: hypothetical protein KA035_03165 [Candidatus Levybacteria bacterium]|nr:hypothetical protein [Candidatus Levybacteria bacterium]
MIPEFVWEDLNNPNLEKLRIQENLAQLVESGKSEFEKQLILKNWTHNKLPLGNPSRDYAHLSSFEILADQKKGDTFYCTQYAQLFLQSATALNWYSRKLSVDKNHLITEKDMHHGVCDIWSNDFNKWYMIDPMHNLHFEKGGIPLNALEIRMEYIQNQGASLKGVVGNYKDTVTFSGNQTGFNTPSNYFWFCVLLRNNFFYQPGLFNAQALLWIDTYNKNKTWFKDGKPHSMYESQFIKTENIDLVFPKMNNE